MRVAGLRRSQSRNMARLSPRKRFFYLSHSISFEMDTIARAYFLSVYRIFEWVPSPFLIRKKLPKNFLYNLPHSSSPWKKSRSFSCTQPHLNLTTIEWITLSRDLSLASFFLSLLFSNRNEVTFILQIEDGDIDPEWTLLYYLRNKGTEEEFFCLMKYLLWPKIMVLNIFPYGWQLRKIPNIKFWRKKRKKKRIHVFLVSADLGVTLLSRGRNPTICSVFSF